MRVVLRPEARREIAEAQAWYEARAVGLGFEFVRAVDAELVVVACFHHRRDPASVARRRPG